MDEATSQLWKKGTIVSETANVIIRTARNHTQATSCRGKRRCLDFGIRSTTGREVVLDMRHDQSSIDSAKSCIHFGERPTVNVMAPIFLLLGTLFGGLAVGVLLWPRHGVLARIRHRRRSAGRVQREDALKHLCKLEASGRQATLQCVPGELHLKQDGKTWAICHAWHSIWTDYSRKRVLMESKP